MSSRFWSSPLRDSNGDGVFTAKFVFASNASSVVGSVNAAAQQWENVSNVDFVTSGPAENTISVSVGLLDGIGGTLAYATSYDSIVFDGYDLGWENVQKVAGHEIGHVIGLNHTYAHSMMAPYYSQMASNPTSFDVGSVRILYGSTTASPTPPSTPQDPSIPPIPNGGGAKFTGRGFVDDYVIGTAGDDDLNGRFGDDTLIGGGGNDRINGSYGDDVLAGGAGADMFGGINSVTGDDVILDFNPNEDFLDLGRFWSKDIFHHLTAQGDDTIVHTGYGSRSYSTVRLVGVHQDQWAAVEDHIGAYGNRVYAEDPWLMGA